MVGERQVHLRRRLLVLSLAAVPVVAVLLLMVVVPAYTNPESRSYAKASGYPALLRALGRPIPVAVSEVHHAEVRDVILSSGHMDGSMDQVVVSSLVAGRVSEVFVDVGDRVVSGQKLLSMNTTAVESELRIAEARVSAAVAEVEEAEAALVREQELMSLGAGSTFDLRQAEARLRGARAAAKATEEEWNRIRAVHFDDTLLVSSQDGLVVEKSVNKGEVLRSPGQPLLLIVGSLYFKANVDEVYSGRVAVGDLVEVRLKAYPSLSLKGRVLRVNPTVQATDENPRGPRAVARTFSAWISLENPPEELAPGLRGTMEHRRLRQALVAPASGVIHFSGGEGLVYVEEGNRARLRKVRYGLTRDGQTEILDGLEVGDRVVATAPEALREGDQLELVEPVGDKTKASHSPPDQTPPRPSASEAQPARAPLVRPAASESVTPSAEGSSTQSIPQDPLTLSANSLGPWAFGSDGQAAVEELSLRLGEPAEDSGVVSSQGEYGFCPGDRVRAVDFGNLVVVNRVDATDRETLAAYRVDLEEGVEDPGLKSIATISGLRVGDTVNRLRELYTSFDLDFSERAGERIFEVRRLSDGDLLIWGPVSSASESAVVRGIYSPYEC